MFFFKQKTAYEMRISDWSSDVCSSDLRDADGRDHDHERLVARISEDHCDEAKGIDRLGKPVIGIEAGVDRESGRCGAHHCEGKRDADKAADHHPTAPVRRRRRQPRRPRDRAAASSPPKWRTGSRLTTPPAPPVA